MLLAGQGPAVAVAAVRHEGNAAAGAYAHAIWGPAGSGMEAGGHGAMVPAAAVPAAQGSVTVYTCDFEAPSDGADEVEDEWGSTCSATGRASPASAASDASGDEGPAKRCRTGARRGRNSSPPRGVSSPPSLPPSCDRAPRTAPDADAVPRACGNDNSNGAPRTAACGGLVLRLIDLAPGLVPAVARVVRLAGALGGHVPLVLVQHRTGGGGGEGGGGGGEGVLLPPPPPPGTVRTLYQMPDGRLLPGEELRSTPAGGGCDGGRRWATASAAAGAVLYGTDGVSGGRGGGGDFAAAAAHGNGASAGHITGTALAGSPPLPWLPQPLWLNGVFDASPGGRSGVSGAEEAAGAPLQHIGALDAAAPPQPPLAAVAAHDDGDVTNRRRSEPRRAGHGAPQPPPCKIGAQRQRRRA